MTMMTIQQCVQATGLSKSFFSNRCSEGVLPSEKIKQRGGRGGYAYVVSSDDLEKFMAMYRAKKKERRRYPRPILVANGEVCVKCTIILAKAPEGYCGELCNFCVKFTEGI